jgi:hypothetical protein
VPDGVSPAGSCSIDVPRRRTLEAVNPCFPSFDHRIVLRVAIDDTAFATTMLSLLERPDVVRQILDPQFDLNLI